MRDEEGKVAGQKTGSRGKKENRSSESRHGGLEAQGGILEKVQTGSGLG